MIKHLSIAALPAGVSWVKPGESVGYMQGAALNVLIKEYPGARRVGYVHARDEENGDIFLYVLEGLRTKYPKTGTVLDATVTFKENGTDVEGYAIYWPERLTTCGHPGACAVSERCRAD